jgi:glycosyltransferase involved in cell wall biosynthesis
LPIDLTRAIAPRDDLAAIARLARVVRTERPDVVHAHSSKAGVVARLARLAQPRLPLVYSPHLYAFAGSFERQVERYAYRSIERILAPAASRVISVCEAEARLARSIGPSDRVRVVYNGIAPTASEGPADPRLLELAELGPVVGALSHLHRRKGLETLIDATPRVLDRHPRVQIAIVGEGPERDALRTRATSRGVATAVHFLGPSSDPISVLRGMRVFTHPTWADAYPYVILEAMSVGVPIVASDVGGIGEAIVDGESGVLVPPRDVEALADGLTTLLDDPGRSSNMGLAARARLERRFTLAAMVEATITVYDEVLS